MCPSVFLAIVSAPISCFANYGQCEGCAIKAEPNQRDYGAPKRLQLGRGCHRDRPGLDSFCSFCYCCSCFSFVACMCNIAKVSLSQCRSIFTAIKALRKYLPWNRTKIAGEFFIFFCEYTQKILLTQIPRTRKRNRTVRTITSTDEYPIRAYSMKRYPVLHTLGVCLLSTKKMPRVGELCVSSLLNRLLSFVC